MKKVTVFSDRAEITRVLNAQIKAGTCEIKVSGLSLNIDDNTVRVAGGIGSQRVNQESNLLKSLGTFEIFPENQRLPF